MIIFGLIEMLQDSLHGLSYNSVKCAPQHIKTNATAIAESERPSKNRQKSACHKAFRLSGFFQFLLNCLEFFKTTMFQVFFKPSSVKISENSLVL